MTKVVVDNVEYTLKIDSIIDIRFITEDVSEDTVIEIPEELGGRIIKEIDLKYNNYRDDIRKPKLSQKHFKKLILSDEISRVSTESFSYINCDEVVWSRRCYMIPFRCFYCSHIRTVTNIDHVHQVSSNSFENCLNLEYIDFPAFCSEISSYTFYNCVNLKRVNNIEHVRLIGQGSFLNCRTLKTFCWPEHCKKIYSQCFSNCESLEKFSGIENTEWIGEFAFENCYSLSRLTLEKVKTIELNPFLNCKNLTVDFVKTSYVELQDEEKIEKMGLRREQIIFPYFC